MAQALSGPYPFRKTDILRVSGRASVSTGVILFVRIRYKDGSADLFEVDCGHTGDLSNEIFRPKDSFLQDGVIETITVDTSIVDRGEYYMFVAIERSPHHYPLAAGYIDITHIPLGYFESALSGRGLVKTITGANPAAGAECVDAVPAGAVWKLLSWSAVLVTDGTGANRVVNLIADDGVVTARYGIIYGGATAQTATLTRTHLFKHGADAQNADLLSFADTQTVLVRSKPLFPDVRFVEGDRFRTLTTAMVAGDDYAAPIFTVEEWLHGT